MYKERINTCRFCGQSAHNDWLVKYGTRHYAHAVCYLDSGKKPEALSEWEKRQFFAKLQDDRTRLKRAGENA